MELLSTNKLKSNLENDCGKNIHAKRVSVSWTLAVQLPSLDWGESRYLKLLTSLQAIVNSSRS